METFFRKILISIAIHGHKWLELRGGLYTRISCLPQTSPPSCKLKPAGLRLPVVILLSMWGSLFTPHDAHLSVWGSEFSCVK